MGLNNQWYDLAWGEGSSSQGEILGPNRVRQRMFKISGPAGPADGSKSVLTRRPEIVLLTKPERQNCSNRTWGQWPGGVSVEFESYCSPKADV